MILQFLFEENFESFDKFDFKSSQNFYVRLN
jgi:hypothetical protein